MHAYPFRMATFVFGLTVLLSIPPAPWAAEVGSITGRVQAVAYVGAIHSETGPWQEASVRLMLQLRQEFCKNWGFVARPRVFVSPLPNRGRARFGWDVEEAFVHGRAGPWDLRIGRLILPWGRADGINPTDLLTPRDMAYRSPNEEDQRLGNFGAWVRLNLSNIAFEMVVLPQFRASRYPANMLDAVSVPGLTLDEADPDWPGLTWDHVTVGGRFVWQLDRVDGALYGLYGYSLWPVWEVMGGGSKGGETTLLVRRQTFRQWMLGADLSAALSDRVILKAEAAWTRPDRGGAPHLRSDDALQTVVGVEAQLPGNVTLNGSGIGAFVTEETAPRCSGESFAACLIHAQLHDTNRILLQQARAIQYGGTVRVRGTLVHDDLVWEASGLLLWPTRQWLARARLGYRSSDAFAYAAGVDLYRGPNDTQFDAIEDALSALFVEVTASF